MQIKKKMMTGIKPTGMLHIGNYVGTIKTILEYSQDYELFLMIADGHALTYPRAADVQYDDNLKLIAALLAFDFDLTKACLYQQTAVKEIFELSWILSCFCNMGLLSRGHAVKMQKDVVAEGEIGVGLYTYSILMAADILSMDAQIVPVGQDQKQHLEICRDLAIKANFAMKTEGLIVPEMLLATQHTLSGTDGRKMSKSYNNTIPLFSTYEQLKKSVYSIPTNSLSPTDPKELDVLFELYSAFANEEDKQGLQKSYETGISWKEVKDRVIDKINSVIAPKREKYDYWINNVEQMQKQMDLGAQKARANANAVLQRTLKNLGLVL